MHSGIPSGILLAFRVASYLTYILAFYLTSILAYLLAIYFGILFGIYLDMFLYHGEEHFICQIFWHST